MATTTPCPDEATLQRFLLGLVPEAEARAIEQHFLTCSSCQEVTAVLPEDSLTRALGRQPTTAERQAEADAAAVVRRLRAVPAPPPLPGENYHVEGYRLLRAIGRGGMGVVFEAEDERLQRRVAVKILAGHLAADEQARERFLREARAAAAVQSDHVVAIHQIGLGQDGEGRPVPYLVMPLLAGESLDSRCRRTPRLPVAEVVRIGAEAARGLAAAHARGLVHRDVKPGNLWLEAPQGRVKILDFGLVQRLAAGPGLTEPGVLVGTLAYLAPEQAAGGPVDHRADLFSLGCVLYQLCTGRPPFTGATALEVLAAIASDRPAPAHEARPDLPRGLSRLIGRLLEKEPAQRPASAAEVEAELRSLLAAPPRPRRRVALPLVLAAALAVGLGLAFWAARQPPADGTPTPAALAPEPAGGPPAPAAAPEPGWRAAVGRVEVEETDARGQPWDTTLLLGDRAAPDLFVEVERLHPGLRERLRRATEADHPLAVRHAMQRSVPLKEKLLAQLGRGDPQFAQKEKELADFKARFPPLDADEQARHAAHESEIAAVRGQLAHTTAVVGDATRADFNSGALPLTVGEQIEVRVWDRDGLAPSQLVGRCRVVVTEAMLAQGATTLPAFERVRSLELRFRPAP